MSKKKKSKRPSMKDVAQLAGVSRTTVSFVINKTPQTNIPQETQAKVWQAVHDLNYRPNVIAQGLRSQKTHTIGFVSDEVATTPYAGKMIQGAQDYAWEHNYLLLLINTGNNKNTKQKAVNTLLDRQVDGIIYATMYHRAVSPPANILETPTVLLDCFIENSPIPAVVPDEVRGGYEATAHLIEQGHKRIGFINENTGVPAQIGRLEGYKQALSNFNLPFDPTLIFSTSAMPEDGYRNTNKILQMADRPTAIFCFNDRVAMGVYNALRQANLTIPNDMAVIGFDNQEIIAAHLYPSLTTMELPHYQMGQWAIQKLLGMINNSNENGSSPLHKLHCPLIKRDSA